MSPALRSRLLGLLLAAASTAIVLGVLEVALRLLNASRGGKERKEEALYTEYDPLLGWRKKPGARAVYARREYTVEVAINSRGLRDVERPAQAPPGTLRVLALGDSFIEGYSVALDKLVTRVLPSRLRDVPCPVDVVNGGTHGYSTDQEYLFYTSEGVTYRPSVVVLFFFYNDIVYNDRQDYFGAPKPIFEMGGGRLRLHRYPVKKPEAEPTAAPRAASEPERGGSALYDWVRDRFWYGAPRAYQALSRIGLWAPMPQVPLRLELRVYERRREPLIEDAWAKTGAILHGLATDVAQAGARLLIVGVPSRMEVDDRTWELTKVLYGADDAAWDRRQVMQKLAEIARRESVEFLDLTGVLSAAFGGGGPKPYFTYDGHWTDRGHAVAADAVASVLRRPGWLRCPAPATTP